MSEVKVNKISPRLNCGTTQLGDAGDTITVSGDLKSNSLKPATGTTLTLGASGDTITLAAGATQSGFGRTGTVDWNTTPITADPANAVSGTGYFANTTSAAFTITLPTSPSAGDIVAVRDYAQTFATNNLTIGRNSQPIDGISSDLVLSTNGEGTTLVYVDGTQGWKSVNSNEIINEITYVAATGGTETTCGNYKIHTFTSPGTFTVTCAGSCAGSNSVSYMVVAGGGGGGSPHAAGGGAGGFREGKTSTDCYTASPLNAPAGLPVTVTGYPITVGGGGSGAPTGAGYNGSNSVFSTITSTGGGGGGFGPSPVSGGSPGGSGGGGGSQAGTGGTGNTPPVSPSQGNNGGNGSPWPDPGWQGGGGGGGAGAAGTPCSTGSSKANGGNGVATSITGSSVTRAGGGGGGGNGGGSFQPGDGGSGGGGRGATGPSSNPSNVTATAGTANTGSGGGGGMCGGSAGAAGGSGIVVIRYKFQ